MKVHISWVIVAAVISCGVTFIGCRLGGHVTRLQDGSMAGQTLVNLSRALESRKTPEGAYPESLDGISVENTGGDYSKAFLRHVIYRRTDDGFVAFVGLPGVAYIDSRKTCLQEFVR